MIKGSLVPNITMFDQQGNVDFVKTEWHMRWMFKRGVDGLFLTGSYGAGPLLSNEERIAIYRLAKKVAADFQNKILIAHVGCADTNHSIELAKEAQKIGVDAIAAVPPFYYKYNDDAIINFYKLLIDSVDLPVFAYNNPETSRYTFNLKTINALKEYGLAGIKDSPLSIGFISQIAYNSQIEYEKTGKSFELVAGTSNGWLPLYFMGIQACIAGMNNWAPEIMTELVRATFAGEMKRAREVYVAMMALSAKLHFTDSTIASHMALYARGYDAGFPKQPMMLPARADPKYAEIRSDIEKAFATLNLKLLDGD